MCYPVVAAIALPILVGLGGIARAEEGFFDSNGVKIRFLTEGNGEAVVLLHGLTGRAESWVPPSGRTPSLFTELVKRYRVIALDAVDMAKATSHTIRSSMVRRWSMT